MVVTNVFFYRLRNQSGNVLAAPKTRAHLVGGDLQRLGYDTAHDLAVFLVIFADFLHDGTVQRAVVFATDINGIAKAKNFLRLAPGIQGQHHVGAAEEKELKELYLSAISNTGKDTHTMYKTIHQLGDAGIRLLNKKARVGWTSHSHTAHAVPVFAIGVGAERFSGWHDNTEIVPLIRKAIE